MSHDFTDDKSTLVQVMAWCCQAASHYLSQCWLRSMSPCDVTRPQRFNVVMDGIYIYKGCLVCFWEWKAFTVIIRSQFCVILQSEIEEIFLFRLNTAVLCMREGYSNYTEQVLPVITQTLHYNGARINWNVAINLNKIANAEFKFVIWGQIVRIRIECHRNRVNVELNFSRVD